MHAELNLTNGQEAFLHSQEGMLLIGMDHLTLSLFRLAMCILFGRSNGEINQIIILVYPHTQDGL
jgi:hypothetical protein